MSTAYPLGPRPSRPVRCRHCEKVMRRPRGHRGLCWTCSQDPKIRALYKPQAPPVNRGRDCAHCGKAPGTYRRGLCRPCYEDPAIRERYPRAEPRAYYPPEGAAPAGRRRRQIPPAEPTAALPGTKDKELVMQRRAELRQPLFLAGDARGDDDRPTDLSAFGAVAAQFLEPIEPCRLRVLRED